jgi:hypothetical protein
MVQALAASLGVRVSWTSLEGDLDGSAASALSIAKALRAGGLPCVAYRMPEHRPLADLPPAMLAVGDEWSLSQELSGVDTTQASAIVGEPPTGVPYSVLRERTPFTDDPEAQVHLFYASPADGAELAQQQVLPDLERILDHGRQEGGATAFIDSVGLIRDQGAKHGVRDRVAFRLAMDQLRVLGTDLAAPAGFQFGTNVPLWRTIYEYLQTRAGDLLWTTENLGWALQRRIVDHDVRQLRTLALNHFSAGQVDEAADVMAQQLSTFHSLNCDARNSRLVRQIEQTVVSEGASRVIVLREIGHVNSIEERLPDSFDVRTKIVATEPLRVLFARIGMETAVANFGVEPTADALRLRALRHCIKCMLPLEGVGRRAFSDGARVTASTCIDSLSEETMAEILRRLHAPGRVFLRNAPHTHSVGEQLQYLLVDLGVIPPELLEDPAKRMVHACKSSQKNAA